MCEMLTYLPFEEKRFQVFLDIEQATHNRVPVHDVANGRD